MTKIIWIQNENIDVAKKLCSSFKYEHFVYIKFEDSREYHFRLEM